MTLRDLLWLTRPALAAIVLVGGCSEPPPPVPPATPAVTVTAPHPDFVVTPGAFCDWEGMNGATEDGVPMRRKRLPGEERSRWRLDDPR